MSYKLSLHAISTLLHHVHVQAVLESGHCRCLMVTLSD
jgi:hypothetical protein